jgi:GDPmannose 4,6-dehydratase
VTRRALITGITGQDGGYLAKLLLAKGYAVEGTHRASSSTDQLEALGIIGDVGLHQCNVGESRPLLKLLDKVQPDEIYNFAGPSFVGGSFDWLVADSDATALGPIRILSWLRASGSKARFYQASSSELFGGIDFSPQDETTPFRPRSPYANAKLFGHWATVNYREAFGLYACSGLLYNHESPWRAERFVTRKITMGFARIKHDRQAAVTLGNLDATRDWGFAGDYVDGVWRTLQQAEPEDFVLATGECHSVRHFAELAGSVFGWTLAWRGHGCDEEGFDAKSGRLLIKVDQAFWRAVEPNELRGNPAKAREMLGWSATCRLPEIAAMMAEADERRVVDGAPT